VPKKSWNSLRQIGPQLREAQVLLGHCQKGLHFSHVPRIFEKFFQGSKII
jgi:hypothetical protein